MRILHAAARDGQLLVWAEDDAAREPQPGARTHPFAATSAVLTTLLDDLALDGEIGIEATAAVAWLPSAAKAPLPGSPLLDIHAPRARSPRLRPWTVPALALGPRHAMQLLRLVRPNAAPLAPGVVPDATLMVLARLARESAAMVLRGEIIPSVARRSDGVHAVWRSLPSGAGRDTVDAVARSLPTAALMLGVDRELARHGEPAPADALRETSLLLDGLVDAIVRGALADMPVAAQLAAGRGGSIHDRWLAALVAEDPRIDALDSQLDALADGIEAWQGRLRRGTDNPFRIVFRLEEPHDAGATDDGDGVWFLRYLVQSRVDPSLLVGADAAQGGKGPSTVALREAGFHAGEHLLAPLGEAAALSEPIDESLRGRRPAGVELTTAQAHAFLRETVPLLEGAGFAVLVPAWWRSRERFGLNLRARPRTELTGGRRGLDSLNLSTLVGYDWRLAIGDHVLSRQELTELAAQKAQLVRVRGMWVELDQAELAAALARIERMAERADDEPETATVGELVALTVGGSVEFDGIPVGGVTSDSDIAELLLSLDRHDVPDAPLPAGLDATLRPYQERGYAWLAAMAKLGLGACLADDMGLGKSVQALTVIQRGWEQDAADDSVRRPTLIVAPTSVLANWQAEAERFTPDLPVLVHHGADRLAGDDLRDAARGHAIIVTSYGVLARDIGVLAAVPWRMTVLDEAQAIKNPGTQHALAARQLGAPFRVALTGTPIENHVGDLWSIMEYLNPGLLGTQRDFRRRSMLPIQTDALPEAADNLARIVRPFVLRRLKTDRSVITDLPDRIESIEHCTLTAEQVALYEAVVRETERILRGPMLPGVERRGLILATLSKLKQACNHPAQLLADNSRIEGRSGKLDRLESLVSDILERGERTLVFTQFAQMGELLRRQLTERFGREVLLLHGGTPRAQRTRMVARFQDPSTDAPPIFVLSLKAGGLGLNLTAASHVVHFDRWWNPAAEQQATDRTYRIGQTRTVHVHTLVCAGTIEERIDDMLRRKRAVAGRVVGSGEQWISELSDDELVDLLTLRARTVLQPGVLAHTGKEWRRARLG